MMLALQLAPLVENVPGGAFGFIGAYRRASLPVRAALIITPLLMLDGYVAGQGIWSLFTFFVGVVVQVLLGLVAFASRNRPRGMVRLGIAGLYPSALCLTVGWLGLNAFTARERAEQVIAACRKYESTHGRLPDRLEQLVPEFLPRVPRAKYTLLFSRFEYSAHPTRVPEEDLRQTADAILRSDWQEAARRTRSVGIEALRDEITLERAQERGLEYDGHSPVHSLMYYAVVPFGRPVYFFEQGRWVYLD